MNLGFRQIIAVLAVLLYAITVPAQEIPVLPADPSILKGVMPNGMSWYVVSNSTDKGVADFALVQKTGRRTVADSVSSRVRDVARETLDSLPRLKPSSPLRFLSRHGVAPGRNGYVKITDDATVFRFEDVFVAENPVLLDSALIMLMDMADRATSSHDEFVKTWYSPADQAVVISGDVDAKAVAQKLTHMSYMIPAREAQERPAYVWKDNEGVSFETDDASRSQFTEVSMTWSSQRVPREYMNTVQPAMFEMAVTALGELSVKRVRLLLEERNVYIADAGYRHVCSEATPYEDSFTIYVTAAAKDSDEVLKALAEVMTSIDREGAGMEEYLLAEVKCLDEMEADASDVQKHNSEYVDRCINSFLYNSSLASLEGRLNFHKNRNLPDSMRLRLFNDIAMALLDGSSNLVVKSSGDSAAIRSTFDSAWESLSDDGVPYVMDVSDTIKFPGKSSRLRIRSVKNEHLSGGSVWTFSNGFKVIYKKMASDKMYYTLALNGGYSSIKGLQPGEGAFMSDYIGSCNIAGMEAEAFMDILQREGISMDVKVNLSNMLIGGYAPFDRMHLLVRSLLAFANQRSRDDDAFKYYKGSEYMRLEHTKGDNVSIMTAIDSIMCPDYRYSSYKTYGKITSGFQNRAEAFFDEASSRMNDGVLVLVGNMEEERLKKLLVEYVGGFRTQETVSRRSSIRYQPVSGWSTYTVDGYRNCVDVALSTRMTVTAENYIATNLAASVLKRKLTEAMNGTGMHVNVSYNCRIYPEERFNMLITVSEIPEDALHETPIESLERVRGVLSRLHEMEVTDEGLKFLKDRLKNAIAVEMKDPRYWVDAIVLRYLDGKDLSTGYASKIDAVNAAKVQSVLRLLDAGCKVEYVTSKKY